MLGFGLLLYLVIIPRHTETVDYGWMRPQTLPNAMAWIILLAGALQALRPTGEIEFVPGETARAGLYLALVVIGTICIGQFGFVYVSPVLALAIMLVIGERRPLWLAFGVVVLPFTIWFVVTILLARPLF
mgnify:CR=1 FL=1